MSDRMDGIKARLREQERERRALGGGHWERRGQCVRCGACCDLRNINPRLYEQKAAVIMERTGRPMSSVCAHHGALPEQNGALGCRLHDKPGYPPGCAAFPSTVEDWRLVMATCGFWFEWVENGPRKVGKKRRSRE